MKGSPLIELYWLIFTLIFLILFIVFLALIGAL